MAAGKDKAGLIALDWARAGKTTRTAIPSREVKMIAPHCEPCQKKGLRNWWEKCPHNPYYSQAPRSISVPVLACSACGEEVEQGTATHCDQMSFELRGTKDKVEYENVPNTRSVPVNEAQNSGQGVPKQIAKGWKFPQDIGIAPMCEYPRCYEPNPKIRTPWGNYCTDGEARAVGLPLMGDAVEVSHDRIRMRQLRSVDI